MAEYSPVQRALRTTHVSIVEHPRPGDPRRMWTLPPVPGALGYHDFVEIQWDEYTEGKCPTLGELDQSRTAHEVMRGRR